MVIQRAFPLGNHHLQHDDDYRNPEGPDPRSNVARPIFLRELARLKKECPQSAKDLSVEVQELMEQVVKEMPDGGWVAIALWLSTGRTISTVQYLAAIATSALD